MSLLVRPSTANVVGGAQRAQTSCMFVVWVVQNSVQLFQVSGYFWTRVGTRSPPNSTKHSFTFLGRRSSQGTEEQLSNVFQTCFQTKCKLHSIVQNGNEKCPCREANVAGSVRLLFGNFTFFMWATFSHGTKTELKQGGN